MAKLRIVITKKERYLNKEEIDNLKDAMDKHKYTNKIHKITDQNYMLELIDINQDPRKQDLKKAMAQIECALYKTTDTLKELKRRQLERDTRSLESLNNCIKQEA